MDEVVIGGIEKREIVVDYDPRWPEKFQKHAEILSRALGRKALAKQVYRPGRLRAILIAPFHEP